MRWPAKIQARNRAKVVVNDGFYKNGKERKRILFKCEIPECGKLVDRQNGQIDHIEAVVKVEGFTNFDEYIHALFCDVENLRHICCECHLRKGEAEQKARRDYKKEKPNMIIAKELNPKNFPVNEEQKANLEILLERMNQIRQLYGKPMVITSGLRSLDDHLRIYREMGVIDQSKIPMKSKHLIGAACDVLDTDGSLMKWCRANVTHLETIGLWIEDDSSVPRVHFQIQAPSSGNRFFKP